MPENARAKVYFGDMVSFVFMRVFEVQDVLCK